MLIRLQSICLYYVDTFSGEITSKTMRPKVEAVFNQLYRKFLRNIQCMLCTSTLEVSPENLGQLGHFVAGSSGSDPLYKLSGSDPDWIM